MTPPDTTNDTIQIHRLIIGEYLPRRATISGGTFDAMKTLIKALDGSRYEGGGIAKSWQVRGAASSAAIQAAGYTLTAWPVLRVDVNLSTDVADRDRPRDSDALSIVAYLGVLTPRGTYTSPDYVHVRMHTTPEALARVQAAQQARYDAWGWTLTADERSAWVQAIRATLTACDATIQAQFNAVFLDGKRSKEAYRAALDAVLAHADHADDPHRTWAVVPDDDTPDGYAVVDGNDPRTQALRADHDVARQRDTDARQAEAAAYQADRIARAPELLRAQLLHDTKDDLLDLAARRGIAVKKSATKVQIAGLLVADRAWCERIVTSGHAFARKMEV